MKYVAIASALLMLAALVIPATASHHQSYFSKNAGVVFVLLGLAIGSWLVSGIWYGMTWRDCPGAWLYLLLTPGVFVLVLLIKISLGK